MGPYPAASSATISPPSLTTVWAEAKLRHGIERPQPEAVFASDPPEATKARWAASAGAAATAAIRESANTTGESRDMNFSLFSGWDEESAASWSRRETGIARAPHHIARSQRAFLCALAHCRLFSHAP